MTQTSVHSTASMQALRRQSLASDQYALCGLNVYAQILIGMALYLYERVGTPGYFSILLTAPFALALLYLARRAAKRPPRGSVRRILLLLLLLDIVRIEEDLGNCLVIVSEELVI